MKVPNSRGHGFLVGAQMHMMRLVREIGPMRSVIPPREKSTFCRLPLVSVLALAIGEQVILHMNLSPVTEMDRCDELVGVPVFTKTRYLNVVNDIRVLPEQIRQHGASSATLRSQNAIDS
jgi:hypothetical protein